MDAPDTAVSMEQCAHLCHECQDECLKCLVHCLELGGEHASRAHQTTLLDCAELCALTHGFLHRGSPHAVHMCDECAEVCRACADDCEKMGGHDKQMKACAEMCRKCAEVCDQMSEVEAM